MFKIRSVHTTRAHYYHTHLHVHVTTAIEFTCDNTDNKIKKNVEKIKHPKQLLADRHNYVKSLSKPIKALRIQSN